jgi:hypothetical protein
MLVRMQPLHEMGDEDTEIERLIEGHADTARGALVKEETGVDRDFVQPGLTPLEIDPTTQLEQSAPLIKDGLEMGVGDHLALAKIKALC